MWIDECRKGVGQMVANSQPGGVSFSPEQVKRVLGSKEGKQLLQMLNRDGGSALRQAATAARTGDYETVKRLLEPVMQTPEAAGLVEKLNRK